jgi:hypothetical protein
VERKFETEVVKRGNFNCAKKAGTSERRLASVRMGDGRLMTTELTYLE